MHKIKSGSWVWIHPNLIVSGGRGRQVSESEVSLVYTVRFCLRKNKKKMMKKGRRGGGERMGEERKKMKRRRRKKSSSQSITQVRDGGATHENPVPI